MTLPDLATLRRLHEQVIHAKTEVDACRAELTANEDDETQRNYAAAYETWTFAMNHRDAAVVKRDAAVVKAAPALLHAADRWAQVQGMKERIAAMTHFAIDDGCDCHECTLKAELLALIDAPSKE